MDSAGKVALVTGGAKRVGRTVALSLADAGYDIAITYLTSEPDANDLVSEVKRRGRRALAIKADLQRPDEAIDRLWSTFNATFARLDVLVNNASSYTRMN